jgi:starch synthase (maltosyl-transferring)
MRGNLFVNTPDILPFILQTGGRPAFMMRATLAATLLPSWGLYNGFELCENRAVPGREEYLDSEKYQYKVWDWNAPGNIKKYLGTLNAIRTNHAALQQYCNIQFHATSHNDLLFYSKCHQGELVLVVVNLNPHAAAEGNIDVPIHRLGLPDNVPYTVRDLLTGASYTFKGYWNYVRLDPAVAVAHIFLVLPQTH